ncbi:MAG: 4-(cytidine 5'-diphospho)-2-C-methyl-D-erythritol kinase, partial [Lachnospiraceae bacterium]|nr:4-(cytidine 5'-diphospho)-2-C-methyl-D-erythritol kinase [Lachnospiraceae bacterium]
YKAARLLMDEYDIKKGVDIQLQKFIPVAAGMAGGSTDAAATLIGMNRLFHLNLSRQQLMDYGVKLGADVPYCIAGGTALSEGIGEILTPLPDVPKGYVLVAKPGINVSTRFVYTNLKLNEETEHPDIDAQIEAIKEQDFRKMAGLMGNVLETVTIPAHPIIQEIKDFMMREGAVNAMMSGSGPTVFGLYEDKQLAEKACEKLRESRLAKMVFLTTFIGQNPYA